MIHLRTQLLALSQPWKRLILVCFDIAALSFCMWLSFALRFERWTLPNAPVELWVVLSAPLVAIPIFVPLGLYRAVIRYLPERAIWTMLQAVTLATLCWVLLAFLTTMAYGEIVPRSVPIIYWTLASLLIVGSRLAAKRLFWPIPKDSRLQKPAVLIYGAGEAGIQLAQSLRGSHFIVGFLDDQSILQGREIGGVRIFAPSHVPNLIRDFGVKQVILSIPSLSVSQRREIVAELSGYGVKVQSLPAMTDIVTGRYLVSQVREIEIDELLGRSSVPPDLDLIRGMIVGRTIMVTGAGGSIGSELCRKIEQWRPQRLVLFEANEFALYQIDKELRRSSNVSIVPVLGSVTNAERVRHAISDHAVEVLFHAAAHKHVPLVEANVLEGIANNVFGTAVVVAAASELGVRDFVLISTDKAVRPTNVMGATKRWAELVVREKAFEAQKGGTDQRFCAVRFGNVLGSNGSVVPLFKEQIAHGGPVTLTDPGMTRYFMSIAEAAELIVQAGALSKSGDVFLLDMGEPILISELAENMVRLAGLKVKSERQPDGDIEIVVIGKRPGEKMYEELFYDASSAVKTRHPKILRATAIASDTVQLSGWMGRLSLALERADEQAAREVLFELVAFTDSGKPGSAQPGWLGPVTTTMPG